MSETQMPATEASVESEQKLTNYEFAFHILPTVAEGEVPGVLESIKALITKAGGTIVSEEMPERFDLAYDIVKYLEGKNRKFSSAYFGWVRFELDAGALTHLTEEIDGVKELLRYIMIKLTKVEEQHPFRFHESLVHKKVHTVTDEEVLGEEVAVEEVVEDVPIAAETADVVFEAAPETDSAETK